LFFCLLQFCRSVLQRLRCDHQNARYVAELIVVSVPICPRLKGSSNSENVVRPDVPPPRMYKTQELVIERHHC
jgi:hypothetical protein